MQPEEVVPLLWVGGRARVVSPDSCPAHVLAWIAMQHEQGCVWKHLLCGHRWRDEQSRTQNRPDETLVEKTKLSLYESPTR